MRLALLALVLVAPVLAQEPTHRLELADGCILLGTLPPGAGVDVVDRAGRAATRPAGEIDRLVVSSVRADEATPGEEALERLAARLGSDEYADRERASIELAERPFLAPLLLEWLDAHPDVEVRARVELAIEARERSGEVRLDVRDLWVAGGSVERGWVQSSRLVFRPSLARETIEFELRAVRSLARLGAREEGEAASDDPPRASAAPEPPGEGRSAVVVDLQDETRLVGSMRTRGDFEDLDLADVEAIVRDGTALLAEGPGGARETRPITGSLVVQAAGRTWLVPADRVHWIDVGPLERHGSTLAIAVRRFRDGRAPGRFWVHIDDQRANPWNTATGRAMTWTVTAVDGDRCVVGSDASTNPYQGDTSIDTALPVLCVRTPVGLDGLEARLTRPIRGARLSSPAEANRLIAAELGEGWRMAEFHDGTGGWRFTARWR